MEADDELGGDREYLFSSCLHLGRVLEEHDAEADTIVKRFRRDAESKDALTIIRRLLKKYHNHDDLPIRRYLSQWRVLRDRLLPMISRFHSDSCVGGRAAAPRAHQPPPHPLPARARPHPPLPPPLPHHRAETFSTTWGRCLCL